MQEALDVPTRMRRCKETTKAYLRELLGKPQFDSEHGREEYRKQAAKERERFNVATQIRDELIDLVEDEGDDAEVLFDAGDQILGGLQRELRKLQEQRKNVRNIRLEFLRWAQQMVELVDAPEPDVEETPTEEGA